MGPLLSRCFCKPDRVRNFVKYYPTQFQVRVFLESELRVKVLTCHTWILDCRLAAELLKRLQSVHVV